MAVEHEGVVLDAGAGELEARQSRVAGRAGPCGEFRRLVLRAPGQGEGAERRAAGAAQGPGSGERGGMGRPFDPGRSLDEEADGFALEARLHQRGLVLGEIEQDRAVGAEQLDAALVGPGGGARDRRQAGGAIGGGAGAPALRHRLRLEDDPAPRRPVIRHHQPFAGAALDELGDGRRRREGRGGEDEGRGGEEGTHGASTTSGGGRPVLVSRRRAVNAPRPASAATAAASPRATAE